ncbi:hypothetical protein MAUB1S_03663 [Mycolicibacterium aubagnense]
MTAGCLIIPTGRGVEGAMLGDSVFRGSGSVGDRGHAGPRDWFH